jgi:hypothetical protein
MAGGPTRQTTQPSNEKSRPFFSSFFSFLGASRADKKLAGVNSLRLPLEISSQGKETLRIHMELEVRVVPLLRLSQSLDCF